MVFSIKVDSNYQSQGLDDSCPRLQAELQAGVDVADQFREKRFVREFSFTSHLLTQSDVNIFNQRKMNNFFLFFFLMFAIERDGTSC